MFDFLQQNRRLFACLALCFAGLVVFAQPAQAQCPGTAGVGPSVFYQSCTETAGAGTSTVLTQPAGVTTGDLLLLSISTDGTTTPAPVDASGWTNLNTVSAQGATMSLWYRLAPTTSANNRTFNFGANEAFVATYMRFTGAESVFGTLTSGNGDPVAPAITVDRANSLVLRLSVKDFRDTDLTGGLTQITTTPSGGGGNGVDTAIGYVNQAGLGTTGTYSFSNTQNSGWIAATLAIRPPKPAVAFRITHSGSGSTCTPTTVTFTAVNEDGGTVTGYTGALTITAPNGNWYSIADEAGGTFSNGTANDGDFTYTMVTGDAGTVSFNYIPNVAGSLDINISSGGISETSHAQGVDQQLTSALCGFTISHDGTHGSCLAAGYQEILISAVESNGSTVRSGYTGTITINTSSTAGVWSAVSGEAEGTINTQSNGNISYTFAIADAGTATLRFTHTGVNATVNFDIFDSIEPSVDALLAENNLVVTGCGFVISHDGNGPTCAYELITLSSTVAGNTETITVTTSTTSGVWVPESAVGSFTSLGNGDFSYAFAPAEGGVATFRLYHQPTATVTFDITDAGMVDVQQGADDPLVFDVCEFLFTAPATGNNCGITDTVLTVVDQGGFTVAGYTGTVTLTTDSGVGIWGQGTATNAPVNTPTVGDGQATLTFAVADAGTVSLELSHDDPGMVELDANDAVYGMVTPVKPTVNILACSFWVSLTSPGDTCTPNDITIEVRNSAGALISDYVGTATITTTFNNGDWSLNGATSTATFTNYGDGMAEYYFSAMDGGSVTLTFTDPIVETTKIIVEDGLLVVDAGHNPDLVIQACRFIISHSGSADLCTPESVTFTLVDSNDMTVTDYEGQIFISTSLPGTWSDGSTTGINNTGGGSANYQFVPADMGSATFTFQGLSIDTYDIDVTDGSNQEVDGDPVEDPELEFTACLPRVTNFSCVNAATTSITLPSSAEALGTRAVVMVTGNEGTIPITNALFNGVGVSASGRLHTVANNTNPSNQRTITEMFAWLDAELPAAGGTYSGSYTVDDGQAMCLIALKNVNQSYPAGTALGSAFADGGTIQSSLTSPAVDAIVISGATVDENGTFNTNTLGNQLASINVADDSWTFAAGYGNTLGTGTVTVTESFTGTVDKWTHAIAAFTPAPAPLTYFRITHDGSTTSCTMQQVTISAYDLNGNIKTDYTGTVTITMDASHGTWSQFPATGVLTENPLDDDGQATYQFAVADGGTKTLNLMVPHNQIFEISVADGSITDDGSHSLLTVTSCEPVITATQCYAGTVGSIDIVGPETSDARAVIMSIARESAEPEGGLASDPDIAPASVVFDGQQMSFVARAEASNGTSINTTEMYVIFDADLPTAAGTYNAAFAEEAGGSFPNTPAMCLTAVYGVEQVVPVAPAVATNTVVVSVTPASLTTTVTTGANNALVMSIVSDDRAGGTYTSDFDTVLWNNQTPPASAVFSGFSGLKAQAGPIADTVVPSGNPTIISHVMASFSPVVAGPPTADDFVPVTLFRTFSGPVNYRAYGSSYRLNPNGDNVLACTFQDPNIGTSVDVDVPPGSTFIGAYLYWTGDGDETVSPAQIDDDVMFLRGTETFSITADEIFLIKNIGQNSNLNYFTGYKDVSAIVNANGTYTLQDLVSQSGSPWQDTSACAAGWALVVVYENSLENIHVINLFHGFQPFQNSSFDLVPRNFRIRANDLANGLPHGQLTHITIEGDADISSSDEQLGLQSAPGSLTFNYLTNSFNPASSQYNSTITRPIYDSLLTWSPTAGVNMDGYEALSLTSYGVDVDTYFLRGDTSTLSISPLYLFGTANPLPEEITTEYSAGQDLVLLVGEVIGVTNAPLVDLEVTITEGPAFIVGNSSTYTISLINNGDGTGPDGGLTGSATVTVTFPAGLTITGTVTASGWSCVANNAPPATPLGLAALACEYDISSPLAEGGSLPSITVPVAIGDDSVFPNLVNQAEINVRALYHGGNCVPDPLDDSLVDFGTSPDPDECGISPQYDNVMDLEGGALSMNDLEEKSVNNNNVDGTFTTINGRKADLQLTKVAGIFTEASVATYTITVTNLGPQRAAKLITVTDTLPAGLTYVGKLETGDNDAWTCGAVGQDVTCTTDTDLVPADSADFLLGVQLSAPAIENATVNNTACVSIAMGNFDTNAANNCDTESVTVQGEAVAGQNKFLISVNLDNTTLGSGTGTLTFNMDDIILYDPVTDVASMFYDDDVVNGGQSGDINALHVRRNGHLVVSPASAGSIAGVNYDVGDLLVYDPILDSATLLFDGSAHFDSAATNIDAVFEQDDGQVVISTTADAGLNGTPWQRGDWVRFNPLAASPTATVILDGDDPLVFNASVQLNGTYFKVGGTPDYVITIGQSTANIATGNTTVTGDDIASLQPGVDSKLEFRGSVPNGVFSPLTSTRFIDGVHIVENGYFGHFAITESVSGSTCTPTTVIISKHTFSDTIDTGYTGSIRIQMTDTATNLPYAGTATLTVTNGAGTLQNTTGNNYIYTFVPGDLGEVTLALSIEEDGTGINLDVSNGLRSESSAEDPDLDFNDVISVVTYADDFSTNNFSGSSGTSSWAGDWIESDYSGGEGAGIGNVRVITGEVYFDNTPFPVDNSLGNLDDLMPGITRNVDLSLYELSNPLVLTYNWRTTSVNAGDSFIVEVKGDTSSGDPWLEVATYTGLAGTNSGSGNFNLSTILSAGSQTVSENTGIRFRVEDNYDVTGSFIIDNVALATGTADCGVGSVHHFEISHVGSGVMCEAYPIEFIAHDIAHTEVAPGLGTVVNLSTSAGLGSWSALPLYPSLNDVAPGDGLATYSFGLAETRFMANFNLTSPNAITPTATINFNIALGAATEQSTTIPIDPDFLFLQAGFIFLDGFSSAEVSTASKILGTQIAGKYSTTAPTSSIVIRAVRTSDDFQRCEALFENQTVILQMGAECKNPAACMAGVVNVVEADDNIQALPTSPDNGNADTVNADVPVSLAFNADGEAEIEMMYNDAGEIQLYAETRIRLDNDPAGLLTNDFMWGVSDPFVVRPFGFRFDLSANTDPFADDGTPDDGFGNPDAAGSAFVKAGQPFTVNLQAVAYVEGSGQDTLEAGHPDPGADLSANPVTPNFGNENIPADRPVATLTHTVTLPLEYAPGTLSGTVTFDAFSGGQDANTDITFSEVGIIDMEAHLEGDYLGSGQAIRGYVSNVGRFTPDHYAITSSAHINRIGLDGFCSPPSAFTYMGEPLELTVNLEARNAGGNPTRNYHGAFVRLNSVLGMLNFSAMDLDTMDVLTGRLDATAVNNFAWSNTFINGDTGEGVVAGNLILDKGASPDGPYDMFTVGMVPVDADGVTVLPADLDLTVGTTPTVSVIPMTGIRYGRLSIDSTGGSEISGSTVSGAGLDIPVTFVLEYYNSDSMNFLVNSLDDCTTLSSSNLAVINDSYTDGLTDAPGGIGTTAAGLAINIGVQTGTLTVLENGSTSSSSAGGDVPFYISAPFAADDTNTATGSVLLELDLDTAVDVNPGAGVQNVTYDYLKFDWRTAGELYDEMPDGTDEDNPRAIIDFGVFQGHNRVINWQEILLTPE